MFKVNNTYFFTYAGRQPEPPGLFLTTSLHVSLSSISDRSFSILSILAPFIRLPTYVICFLPLFSLPCNGCHKIQVDAISSGCLTQLPDSFSLLSLIF